MTEEVVLPYHGCPSLEYRIIPEAADLTWEDNFFDRENRDVLVGSQNVIAVFDYDYQEIERFVKDEMLATQSLLVGSCAAYGGFIGTVLSYGWLTGCSMQLCIYGLSYSPCMISQQVRWAAQAQHVAVTEDGIRFVQDKRKAWWGLKMCDQAKTSRTVPFEQIIDCDVFEPAGNACLCIPRTLVTVTVTTSSPVALLHVLRLTGLKEPYKFSRLVWALKRSKMSGSSSSAAYFAPTNATMYAERGIPCTTQEAIRDDNINANFGFFRGSKVEEPVLQTKKGELM